VLCVVGMCGVTQLHDVVYMIASTSCSTIVRFNATTHERLASIDVWHKGLTYPEDIVACEQTSHLYVADVQSVVRLSADGDTAVMLRLTQSPSDAFSPTSLSVTSTRLLVTSVDTKQLIQFESLGDTLRRRRVQLPYNMEPRHAVESPTGTFIVSHSDTRLEQINTMAHHLISEVNTDGQVLRQFIGSRLSSLSQTRHIAIDSHGNVFVADHDNDHILLLNTQLKLRRVIIDEHQLNYQRPWRLCYRESTGQLLVGLKDNVAVFDVLCR